MGGRNCCVKNCRRRSHDHRGRKIPNGLTFHCFPAWRRREGGHISALTRRRRAAWVSAVGRSNITFNHIHTSMRVCSRHFISGKPAYEMLESDPDWLPSLHMGSDGGGGGGRRAERLPVALQDENQRKKSEKKKHSAAAGETTTCRDAATHTDVRRPVVPLWTDVKSLLQSVLQKKPNVSLKPADETQNQPTAEETNISFRDFFREALEASLDASIRSRISSSRTPYKVELSFQLPAVKEEQEEKEQEEEKEEQEEQEEEEQEEEKEEKEEKESCESSSCLNCVRLQRKVEELEEKLSRLSGGSEETQSPELVHMKEKQPARLQPVSPPAGHQDVDSADDSTPLVVAGSLDSWRRKPRTGRWVPRFQKSWLKTFWFLRYSPSLDLMWCHVCRLHTDKTHQNLSLIKGSQMFKVHNIKKHSHSNYHRQSVERHLLHTCELQP